MDDAQDEIDDAVAQLKKSGDDLENGLDDASDDIKSGVTDVREQAEKVQSDLADEGDQISDDDEAGLRGPAVRRSTSWTARSTRTAATSPRWRVMRGPPSCSSSKDLGEDIKNAT